METDNVVYDHKTVEKKWLKKWERTLYSKSSNYTKATNKKKPKFFCMDTFAYPSAKGVHVGYTESFGATDMIARYHRMKGYNVFYPMGYDTFGLPAENYAIKTGIHPKDATDSSIENIHRQYRRIGLSYNSETYLNTADIDYYKWTQWLFLKLYEHGLAYRSNDEVGYCDSCKTVISKEQIIEGGTCERCGSEIVTKKFTQWYFKITEYQERLYKGIDKLDWPKTGKNLHKKWIARKNKAGEIEYRLHDWCISRQRYWGTPIPIVYCEKCGEQPVPMDQIPVILPYDVDYIPTGTAPLKKNKDFYENGSCPVCGAKARREVDVMDTFVSSSWYMYRYFDPQNQTEPFSKDIVKKWFPIDWYQGAQEHYTAHLIYSRFIAMFLYDIGYLDVEEPVNTYIGCGLVVAKNGGKFSKRLANAPDMDEEVEKYGADTLRMYTQFAAPFQDNVPWDQTLIPGVNRFLKRVYRIAVEKVDSNDHPVHDEVKKRFNEAIDQIERSFGDYNWNVAISRMMDLVNEINKDENVDISIWKNFIRMLAPFAPFITEELWEMVGEKESVHKQDYPSKIDYEEVVDEISIAITVNGKKRGEISVLPDAKENVIVSQARTKVQGNGVKENTKYVYIDKKLVNFIV